MQDLYRLVCPACRAEQEPEALRCSSCGGLLGVALTRALAPGERHPFADVPGLGAMWRANPVLPIGNPECIVSLGEGGTPCVRAAHLGADAGVSVWLKNEAANPTGSFKDRQVSVGISHARDATRSRTVDANTGASTDRTQASPLRQARFAKATQARGFVGQGALAHRSFSEGGAVPHGTGSAGPEFYVVSSGNVAAAGAAYSARAGARCWVFAPASAPMGKLLQVQLCGARVMRVEGASAEQLFVLAEAAAAEFGWHPLSTAARSSPFNIVGARTIAAELLEQMPAPDWVVVPVGGGGLLGSLWQGFQDAAQVLPGLRLPRLAGVQAAGCAPLVRAVERGWSAIEALANPWQGVRTIAGGLADDIPFDAHLALPAVRESEGAAIAVTDEEIRKAQRLLGRQEGLFIEPSGAVSVAGLLRLIADGRVRAGEIVCCLLTGSGLKDPGSVGQVPEPPVIPPSIEEVRRVVGRSA
jgi:threonine synthase